MRADELRDAGSLAGTALGEIADVAQGVHRAVVQRLFTLAGRPAEPVRAMHDGIAALAYGGTRLGVTYLPPAVGLVAGAFSDPAAESAHDVPRSRFVLGAISGFWGDRLAEHQPALAPQMRMRLHGGRLRHLPANLAADASTQAVTGRVAVFAHGLCETDLCWSYAAEKRWGDRHATYGSKLREDDGWTPLYLNFNTGLHISDNGRQLADQLEELVAGWPVPVTEIALIGHSLGGLVARSAAHQADAAGHDWVRSLRHVVGLGTPHLGAPLERFANWGTHRLNRHPETQPFGQWLGRRSVGIKDLRHGALIEDDWLDFDPDDVADHCTPAIMLPGVAYSVVSATLSREPQGVFAIDLLVQHGSAHGIGTTRSIPFERERTFHVGGRKHHFDLLADDTIYQTMRRWLNGADGSARPERTGVGSTRRARTAARRRARRSGRPQK